MSAKFLLAAHLAATGGRLTVTRSPDNIKQMRVSVATRPSQRIAVWLIAVPALLCQLFITQVHSFMGPLGWAPPQAPSAVGEAYAHALAMGALCTVPMEDSGKAKPDQRRGKSPDCPIYRSLPVFAVSLILHAIELVDPFADYSTDWPSIVDAARPDAPYLHSQARAPPPPNR